MSSQCVSSARSPAAQPCGAMSSRWRLAAALAVILLVAWTQLFLGVHELSHLGQRDASACRFALVATTCGGGTATALFVLFAPLSPAAAYLVVPGHFLPGVRITQQARAPPALS
jgi:hypothetical protein